MTTLDHPGAAQFEPQPGGRVFINAAYMSPKPIVALQAMQRMVLRLASPDFGVEEFFDPLERIRSCLAQIVGGQARSYSLTGSVSFGMATIAWNLRTNAGELVGDRRRIVGVDGQFPSNVHTWRRLEGWGFALELVPGGVGATERVVDAIDERTALVAVAPLSWTDGQRLDTKAICRTAAERGALSLMDVTQSAGVDPAIDSELPVDAVIGAGYKWLLGPYGVGYMRLSAELQERMEPLEANWKNFEGAQDFNRLTEYTSDWASPAAKFDHGESSAFIRLAGWEAALGVLLEIGVDSIAAHTRAFATQVREALDLGRFEVSEVEAGSQASHLFRVAPKDPAEFEPLSEVLEDAHISVSRRNGGWRLSPHIYNTAEDAHRFASALR